MPILDEEVGGVTPIFDIFIFSFTIETIDIGNHRHGALLAYG